MTSQHRFTNRNYRPADDEHDPARDTIKAAGYNMNQLIRAMLRRFNANPAAELAALDGHLKDVAADTPRGRPRGKKT